MTKQRTRKSYAPGNAMRPDDVKYLIRFNTKMSMFICPCNRENVVAFIHGYQGGTSSKCRFTDLLGTCIEEKYRLKPDARGWPGQIEQYADRHSIEWMDAYWLLSSELLNLALNSDLFSN